MICKVCGKKDCPQTVGGICSEECVNKLKIEDKKNFLNELHILLIKYANSPHTLDFNDLKEVTTKGIDELNIVW